MNTNPTPPSSPCLSTEISATCYLSAARTTGFEPNSIFEPSPAPFSGFLRQFRSFPRSQLLISSPNSATRCRIATPFFQEKHT